jgi:hypothetical protein
MKKGPKALSTAGKESGRAKHENGTRRPRYRRKRFLARKIGKWNQTPSVPPKTSLVSQNMKMGPDAHGTAGTRPIVQNMKKGPDALGTAEKESGSAKYENGTRRPRYHRNQFQKGKT